jgi:hypothetical protein
MPFPPSIVCDLNKRALYLICENFEPRGTSDVPTISNKQYRIPHYQRFYIWTLQFQQNFIESILKGYPIPSIMLSQIIENSEEYFMVEDGQQRLTTAYRFMNNEFSIVIDGEKFTYSQLPEDLRMRFRMYEFQTITYRARDLTLNRRIEMFQSTNDHKSLTDNDRFYSCMDLPMGIRMAEIIETNHIQIKKYFGAIGKGKTRSLLSDFAGMCISISRDEISCLTTSYYKNGKYMKENENSHRIQPFLDLYFEMLDAEVSPIVTKVLRKYGKLSGVLGLAVYSYVKYGEIDSAISWYVVKLLRNKKYVPSTFKTLGAGDIRNCQGDCIMKRFDKIVEQFDINKDDIGLGVDGHESQSDDE